MESVSDDFELIGHDETTENSDQYSEVGTVVDEPNPSTFSDDDVEYITSPASVQSFDSFSPSPGPSLHMPLVDKTSIIQSKTSQRLCANIDPDHLDVTKSVDARMHTARPQPNQHTSYSHKASLPAIHVQFDVRETYNYRKSQPQPPATRYDYYEKPDDGPPGSGILVPMSLLTDHAVSAGHGVAVLHIKGSFTNHVELDSSILDLLIEHALNARARLSSAADTSANLQLKRKMLLRLMQLPSDHPVIRKFSEDLGSDADVLTYKEYLLSAEARQVVYRQVFTDVERVASWLLMQVHERHFQKSCTFANPFPTSGPNHSCQIDAQTRKHGQQVARLIQDKCIDNLHDEDATSLIFGSRTDELKKSTVDALQGLDHLTVMYAEQFLSPEQRPHTLDYNFLFHKIFYDSFEDVSLSYLVQEEALVQGARSQVLAMKRDHGDVEDDDQSIDRVKSPRIAGSDRVRSYTNKLRQHTLQQLTNTTKLGHIQTAQIEPDSALQSYDDQKRLLAKQHTFQQQFLARQQDYQMQLMLLEQQNKKRLLMARHEQHKSCGLSTKESEYIQQQQRIIQRERQISAQRTTADAQYAAGKEPDRPSGCAMALPIRLAPCQQTTVGLVPSEHYPEPIASKGRLSKGEVDKIVEEAERQQTREPLLPRLRKDSEGRPWLAFEYTKDRVKMEYTIRCDIARPDLAYSPRHVDNDVFEHVPDDDDYALRERLFELPKRQNVECQVVKDWGHRLAQLNPVLNGKRRLLIEALLNLALARYEDGSAWSYTIPYVRTIQQQSKPEPAIFSANLAVRTRSEPCSLSDQRYQRTPTKEEHIAELHQQLDQQLANLEVQRIATIPMKCGNPGIQEQAQARQRQQMYLAQRKMMEQSAAITEQKILVAPEEHAAHILAQWKLSQMNVQHARMPL